MRFGFHISIAGDLTRVAERAARLSCRTVQIFAGNPRSWKSKDLDPVKIMTLRQALVQRDIGPLFVHMPYLPNLAAEDDELYERSVLVLCDMLERTGKLGASGLVTHPGHYGRKGEAEALCRIAAAVNRALAAVPNGVPILFENTAGQGKEIGPQFRQLGMLLKQVNDRSRVGVCLDTAHAFAAGYDLSTKDGLDLALAELGKAIGLKKLRLLHLNDAKAPLGSRVDRHCHIGEGYIGAEGMKRIVTHPLLMGLPAVMETPKKKADDDIRNMETVLRLAAD